MKHWPIRQDNEPGHATVYVASCGYESTNKKEFVDERRHGLDDVTCQACKEKYSLRKERP